MAEAVPDVSDWRDLQRPGKKNPFEPQKYADFIQHPVAGKKESGDSLSLPEQVVFSIDRAA